MAERTYSKTYIKEWREYRGLSLRRLADRLELDGPDETLSHSSIGRIENGQQPYSQPILEALASALNVSVTDLLSVDPTKEGEVVDLVRLINQNNNRELAVRLLKSLTGTDG
ncbi:helix-turn-helix transcriptional regulator [Rhizobium sp. WYCCWR 11152]|jgi:transcriptional regulator with XRE-family HTH domain|uniref:helix-turn-helix domain-containing protein n=1 Tax=Rhizobium sp. WYCCWR 11152 TaxID=2692316 RepID=UPI0014931584|nr:helix-turn-helix transcriptional regulator [Rhizobium sp. WYCCWR 11152]NNU70412.1 helix-turn-helix transcriptional regulator [Rhizobium sp. WYCCWR 11152]